jgi:hypothetical protein
MSYGEPPPKLTVPFSADQVESLNAYQLSGFFHEFTCGNPDCPGESAILIATGAGWECPASGCGYTQDWAHVMMADWSWKDKGTGGGLSRFGVSVDGKPVSGRVVTMEIVSACCGADAHWREAGGSPPWTCASCWEPCDTRAARP